MIDCLKGSVEIRKNATALSGVTYIDDLPGISEKFLNLLTADNENNISLIWEKVERRGINNMYQKILSEYSKPNTFGQQFVQRSIVSQIETGNWLQPFETVASELFWAGLRIYLYESDNLELNLESLQIYNDTGSVVNSQIKVFDLYKGTLLDSIDYEIGANSYQTIDVNKRYKAKIVLIAYNREDLTSRKTSQNQMSYYSNKCSGCGFVTSGDFVKVANSGVEIINHNVVRDGLGGMIARYSVGCSLDNFLCRQKIYLAPILAYQLGLELFMEIVGSDRINPSTNISEKEYGIILSYFDNNLREGIENFVRSRPIEDHICFKSQNRIQRAVYNP